MTFVPYIIDIILMGLWEGEDYFVVVNGLISVIIPVYNIKIDYLESCIGSILQQTYCQFEIVIVDDGSCSKCAKELENVKRQDDRIFVYHKKNEGVSVARNFGLEHAKGEYIVYADGDDLLTPYYFENGIKKLEENRADIVIGKVVNTSNRDYSYSKQMSPVKTRVLKEEELLSFRQHVFSKKENDWGKDEDGALFNFEGCWAHIIRREVAEKESFVPGISVGEDTIWALQLSEYKKAYRICLIYDVWYVYIQNEGSVLHSYKSKLPDVLTRVNELIFIKIKDEPKLADQYYEWVFVKLRQIAYNYLSVDCKLSMADKIKEYTKIMKLDIWQNILGDKSVIPRQFERKRVVFRNGLILLYFAMRIRWKERK